MLSRNRLKEIASLSRRKYRRRTGQFIVEGERLIDAALAAGAEVIEIVCAEGRELPPGVSRRADDRGVPVHVIPEGDLARISDVETSQGILAVAASPLKRFDAIEQAVRIVVLDRVQDPGNAGAIIRSAAWFGVDAVVAAAGTVDLLNPKTVRATMGGLWDVDLVEAGDDVATWMERLQAKGLACYAADLGGVEAGRWAPQFPSALILGSEAHGVSAAFEPFLTDRIHIAPGRDDSSRGVESLNVAAAAAILFSRWQEPAPP